MRIAWITPYFPAPADSGGRIRTAYFAAALADSNDLCLYTRLGGDDQEWESWEAGKGFGPWRSVHTRRWIQPRGKTRLWHPPQWVREFPPELSHLVAEHHRTTPFDLMVVEHCYAAHALPQLENVKVVLDEHNVESNMRRRAALVEPRRMSANVLDFIRWRRWERSVWRRADAIAVVSESDANEVRKVRPDATVIPNGIDLGKYRFIRPSERRGAAILFIGLLSYEPNRRAALLLATRVLPAVRKLVPDATLTLAGRDPGPEIRALASRVIQVPGTLKEVAHLFDEHAAFAMPLSLGGGSSLKVLEPLATGLPLVATRFAVRGYPLTPGQHYLPAETPEEMAQALARAIEQRRELDAMAERGRSVAQGYGWDDLGARFAELVQGAVLRKR